MYKHILLKYYWCGVYLHMYTNPLRYVYIYLQWFGCNICIQVLDVIYVSTLLGIWYMIHDLGTSTI